MLIFSENILKINKKKKKKRSKVNNALDGTQITG